jgi:DNA polymerase III alpha subunit
LHRPTLADTLREEHAQLGLSPKGHPARLWQKELAALARDGRWVRSDQLGQHNGRGVRCWGWLVTWRRTRVKHSGEMMRFITLEDFWGTFEVTLFPAAYRVWGRQLEGPGPYMVAGRVENDRGGITVNAAQIKNVRK